MFRAVAPDVAAAAQLGGGGRVERSGAPAPRVVLRDGALLRLGGARAGRAVRAHG